jgi:DoxX-like family
MQFDAEVRATSTKGLWAGSIITGFVALFLFFDAIVKVLKLPMAVDPTVRLGYRAGLVYPIGLAELVCIAAYLFPRTSVLGAILLTGYLGGATATQVRVEDPWFCFPVIVGALVWAGLFFRNTKVRAMVPLQK